MLKKLISKTFLLFLLIFAIGAFLRIYQFPNLPNGINPDEASAAYEAYSIMLSGKDRWGNVYPMYFPSWGSGQNALLTYLTIPFIQIFGFNLLSARLPSLILGLLTLIILFFTLKKLYNKKIAFMGMFLLAILPWHVMISRWSLESNILVFMLLLSIFLLSHALIEKPKKIFIYLSLIPLALGLYSYSLSLFLLPIFIILVFIFNKKTILENKKSWIISFSLFLLFSVPMGLFILKNNILHSNLGIEQFLPFGIPLFPSNRIDQVGGNGILSRILENLRFFFTGFNDYYSWNVAGIYLPLGIFILPFVVFGFSKAIKDFRNKKLDLFFAMLISYLPAFFMVELNVNRFNMGILCVLVLSCYGLYNAMESVISYYKNSQKVRTFLYSSIILLSSVYSIFFASFYFNSYGYYAKGSFNPGFDKSIHFAKDISEQNQNTKVLISKNASLNYLYFAFYLKSEPNDFRENLKYEIENGGYKVLSYKNYYFDQDDYKKTIGKNEDFYMLMKFDDKNYCEDPVKLFTDQGWSVVKCNSGKIIY